MALSLDVESSTVFCKVQCPGGLEVIDILDWTIPHCSNDPYAIALTLKLGRILARCNNNAVTENFYLFMLLTFSLQRAMPLGIQSH